MAELNPPLTDDTVDTDLVENAMRGFAAGGPPEGNVLFAPEAQAPRVFRPAGRGGLDPVSPPVPIRAPEPEGRGYYGQADGEARAARPSAERG